MRESGGERREGTERERGERERQRGGGRRKMLIGMSKGDAEVRGEEEEKRERENTHIQNHLIKTRTVHVTTKSPNQHSLREEER